MLEKVIGFRSAKGKFDISLEGLVARICEVAEEEEAFWQSGGDGGARIMATTDPGKGRVLEYLSYLWDGSVPRPFRSKGPFDPSKHAWSAIFVCYCVTKAFDQLYGFTLDRNAFRRNVPLDRSQTNWHYARSAYRKRQQASRGANTRGYYWAYDAGKSIKKGDIVLRDRRSLKADQKNLEYDDLGTLNLVKTHGGIVATTSEKDAVLIRGDVENGVRRVSLPLTEDGRVNRNLLKADANRTFAVLRLKPCIEMVVPSGTWNEMTSLRSATPRNPVPSRRVCDSGDEVRFPSGESLCVVPEVTSAQLVKRGAEHWDNYSASSLEPAPLLEVENKYDVQLSDHFTVKSFVRVGHGEPVKYARIDPKLVMLLETMRQAIKKPIKISSGYRSYQYNVDLYKRNDWGTPSISPHVRGVAADIWVDGMSGMELAKAAIDTFGCDMGLGIFMSPKYDYKSIHVDCSPRWHIWTYRVKDKEGKVVEDWAEEKEELVRYRLTKHDCG